MDHVQRGIEEMMQEMNEPQPVLVMKKAATVPIGMLHKLVDDIAEFLFRDTDEDVLTYDKDVRGSDFIEFVSERLSDLEIMPVERAYGVFTLVAPDDWQQSHASFKEALALLMANGQSEETALETLYRIANTGKAELISPTIQMN